MAIKTYDIKANFSAVGDGVRTTATVSITSGAAVLTSSTDLWTAGDVGKVIAVSGAGSGSPAGVLGSTIQSFTNARSITLSSNASTTLSNSSQLLEWGTSDTTAFDAFNAEALTWLSTHPDDDIVLTIPAGTYIFGDAARSEFTWNIPRLTVQGASSATTRLTDCLGTRGGYLLGGIGYGFNTTENSETDPYIATAARGSTTVTLLNIADNIRFSVGDWACLTGIDLQGAGSPPNNYVSEYVQIVAINGATITLTSPIKNTYLSTWPTFISGGNFQPDQGGPAQLREINIGWDCIHEYTDLNLAADTAVNAKGRHITTRRLAYGSTQTSVSGGINPSENQYLYIIDCSGANIFVEPDKAVDNLIIQGGEWKRIHIQSASIQNILYDGITVNLSVAGTGKNHVIKNSDIEFIFVGPVTGYGMCNVLNVIDSEVRGLGITGLATTNAINRLSTLDNGVITIPYGDDDGVCVEQAKGTAGNLNINGAWASGGVAAHPYGVLFYPRIDLSQSNPGVTFTITGTDWAGDPQEVQVVSGAGTTLNPNVNIKTINQVALSAGITGTVKVGSYNPDPPPWVIPQGNCLLTGAGNGQLFFKIGDYYRASNGDLKIVTTLTETGWPPLTTNFFGSTTGPIDVSGHPCARLNFVNVTGCAEAAGLCNAPPGKPYRSYQKYVFSGNPTGDQQQLTNDGDDAASKIPIMGNLVSLKINVLTPYTGVGNLNLTIDMFTTLNAAPYTVTRWTKTVNLKIAGERIILPGSVSGTQSGDDLSAPGAVRVYPGQIVPHASANIAGQDVVVSVEVITDHGITPDNVKPLNVRL